MAGDAADVWGVKEALGDDLEFELEQEGGGAATGGTGGGAADGARRSPDGPALSITEERGEEGGNRTPTVQASDTAAARARGMGAASAFEHRAEAGEIGALPRGVAREESHEESIGESIDVEAALRKSGAVHTHLQDKARRTTATRPFEI